MRELLGMISSEADFESVKDRTKMNNSENLQLDPEFYPKSYWREIIFRVQLRRTCASFMIGCWFGVNFQHPRRKRS